MPRNNTPDCLLTSLSDDPQTLNNIRSATILSDCQTRYTLGKLIASGNVVMPGSQGGPDEAYFNRLAIGLVFSLQ